MCNMIFKIINQLNQLKTKTMIVLMCLISKELDENVET